MNTGSTSITLNPPWAIFARLMWIFLTSAALIVFIISTIISVSEPLPSCTNPGVTCGPWSITREDIELAEQLGLPAGFMTFIVLATPAIAKLAFFIVGLLIFLRRSNDLVALLMSLMLTMFLVEGVQNLGGASPLVGALYIIPTFIFVLLPFIFPNGYFVPGWTKWLAICIVVLLIIPTLLPYMNESVDFTLYSTALLVTFVVWFLFGGYSAVNRYRRISTPSERQQTKWVLAGLFATFMVFVPFIIILIWFPPDMPSPQRLAVLYFVFVPVYLIGYLGIPAGIAFAILRYRLWDIDVIIRKTLIYGGLSLTLVVVYYGGVILFQNMFEALSGQQSPLAIVISTLLIAALFNPLRQRIQAVIDRRFYRDRYDAEKSLISFIKSSQTEANLETLEDELASVIIGTLHPEQVSIWLKAEK